MRYGFASAREDGRRAKTPAGRSRSNLDHLRGYEGNRLQPVEYASAGVEFSTGNSLPDSADTHCHCSIQRPMRKPATIALWLVIIIVLIIAIIRYSQHL